MSILDGIKNLLDFEVDLRPQNKKNKEKEKEKIKKSKRKKSSLTDVKVIRVLSGVPKFNHVMSLTKDHKVDDGLKDEDVIAFNDELKENYIVLNISTKEVKKALIITAIESADSRIDNRFLSIRRRCFDNGFKVEKKNYASKEIIKILYEKNTTKKSSDDGIVDKAELIEKFDSMLIESVIDNVSDMHFEVTANGAKVKYRKNGALNLNYTWGSEYADRMSQVIYTVLAEEKDVTFDPSTQQAAIINRQIHVPGEGNISLRVRLNTMPAYPAGYNVVMRLLKMGQAGTTLTLEMLGYSQEHIESIKESMSKPVGCTIISGTTGSGKSTSLSVMLTRIVNENMDPEGESCMIKIITVEDPPEYEVAHVVQSPVVRSKTKGNENPFAESIRAALRADPDILMVGEVRDEHSAKLLVGAVQSGHQAFTTVHAPSAIGIVSRLRSLGVTNDVLGNGEFIAGLIYQALLPINCSHCKLSFHTYMSQIASGKIKIKDENKLSHEQMIDRLRSVTSEDEIKKVTFKNIDGCNECKKTGISGRTVVAEVIIPDKYMISCFFDGKEADALHYFIKNGGLLALDHGIDKMLDGISDPRSIEHKLGRMNNSLRIERNQKKEIPSPGLENKVFKSEIFTVRDDNDNDDNDDNIIDMRGKNRSVNKTSPKTDGADE